MKVLVHVCCGPCAIVPFRELTSEGHTLSAALVNPNIHPYLEFCRRRDAARDVAEAHGIAVVHEDQYGLREFLRAVVGHEHERCPICYQMRLDRVAQLAREGDFDAFTTSMLVSTQQDHDGIRRAGEEAGIRHGIEFLYRDYRPKVMEGVSISKEMGTYRQQYCGCVYSEWERHAERE